jgi:hypothetical protein
MNLLTDIETFSISAASSASNAATSTDGSGGGDSTSLNHEIQLLIDECLVLVVGGGQQKEVGDKYRVMFESWLESSKDSPILTHFINRISRSYNLLIASSSSETYCQFLELCLDVFFETNREGRVVVGEMGFETTTGINYPTI